VLNALMFVAFASLFGLGYFLKRLMESAPLPARDLNRLNLPILGVKESGKTLLLATLGEQLTSTSTERLTTRLLTRREEEEERGRTLKPFDPADLAQPPLAPGERSTEAMIFFERRRFEREGVSETTLSSEDALFSVQFATSGPLKGPKVCKLEDVPGEEFMEERHHNANLAPRLARADGLVLVVDGPKALAAGDAPPPEHVLYKQTLEEYLDRKEHGPVWVVVTKADLLPEDRRDEVFWREHTLRHVAPLLKLEGSSVTFELSLVSARRDCVAPWRALERAGEEFFVSLKGVLERREAARVQRERTRQRAWVGILGCALACGAAAWGWWGAYQVESLPRVGGEVAWDVGSLAGATAPRLALLAEARGALSPIGLFEETLRQDLSALRRAHWALVRDEGDKWGGRGEARAVSEALRAARAFSDARAQEEAWSEEERALGERVTAAIKEAGELERLEAERALLAREAAWGERCDQALKARGERERGLLECAMKQQISARLATSRRAHLEAAGRAAMAPTDVVGLRSKLAPLLAWEWDNADLARGDELVVDLERLKAAAWEGAWGRVEERLAALKEPSEAPARLRLLQRLELDRAELKKSARGELEMTKQVNAAWRERLSRECVEVKDGQLNLLPSQRAEADEVVEWAAEFLDPSRRARVRFRSKEARWRAELREGLAAAEPQAFDEALKVLQHDLDELFSEEGRAAIEKDIEVWRNHLRDLRVWRAPSEAPLTASGVTCDFERLAAEGLDHGAGSRWDTDKFSPYLALSISARGAQGGEGAGDAEAPTAARRLLLLDAIEDAEDAPRVRWAPWSTVSLKLYELDGDVDGEPGVEESDDHLISDAGLWRAGGEPPRATVKLTPEGSCTVTLKVDKELSEWVYSELLAERP